MDVRESQQTKTGRKDVETIEQKERMRFRIGLAGVIMEIWPLHGTVRNYCKAYIRSGKPEITIRMEEADIIRERKQHPGQSGMSDAGMETASVYRKIAEALIDRGILLIHGSAVALQGKGYLFLAPSGTGKSTHTRLWREVFHPEATMINDDKPLLRIEQGIVRVCGTPWDGKHRLSTNRMVPLQAICLLERGEKNRIRRLPAQDGFSDLLRHLYHPFGDRGKMAQTLVLAGKVRNTVPLFRMEATMEEGAAKMAWKAMKEEEGCD